MQMSHPEHFHQPVAEDSKSAGSGATLTLISLAHGINHAQAALKPLVFPLVLRELNFGYTELGIMLGVASAVGASLISHHFKKKRLGVALATHFTAGNIGTAFIPLCAAIMIGLWGWRATTILFAVPAILVGIALCFWLKDPAAEEPVETRRPKATFWQDSSDAVGNRSLRWILVAAVVAAGGSGHGIVASFLPLYLSHNLGRARPWWASFLL
jgi:nitrate/nitrite transporter NarK